VKAKSIAVGKIKIKIASHHLSVSLSAVKSIQSKKKNPKTIINQPTATLGLGISTLHYMI